MCCSLYLECPSPVWQTPTYPLSPGSDAISPVELFPTLPELSSAPSGLLLLWLIYLFDEIPISSH